MIMIYLKRFNENGNTLEELCRAYIDGNDHNSSIYKIEGDHVDTTGNISLNLDGLDRFPIKFGKVNTMFVDGLTSLEGSPEVVDFAFNIIGCRDLTSLEGGPKYIGRFYHIDGRKLDSLEGIARPINDSYTLTTLSYDLSYLLKTFLTQKDSKSFLITYKDYENIQLFNYYDPLRPGNVLYIDRLNTFLKQIGKETVESVSGWKCK